VGYWTLDENTGTTAYDRSGSGNNGTLGTAPATPTWVAGKYGSALSFDGSDDYVDCGTGSTLNITTAITAEAWVYMTDDRAVEFIAGRGDTGAHGWWLGRDGGYLKFDVGNGTTYSQLPQTGKATLNRWHHVAGTWDGTTIKIYVDGILSNSTSIGGPIDYTGVSTNTYIGFMAGQDAARHFKGLIDSVKIYAYARSAAQIAYDYNKGAPVANYKFDEGGGTIAHNEYTIPQVLPHRYWRFVQTAILTSHAPRTCELRWTDLSGATRTPDSYTHGGTFQDESLWNASFDGLTNTIDQGWISGNTGYINADFGTSGCAMMKFEAYGSYTVSARGATWDIQYSDDNSNWTTIKTWNFQTSDNGGGLGVGNYAGWYGTTWHTHGTLVGDAKFVDGKIGKALTFDGTGDYVEIPDSDLLNVGTADFTMSAWFKNSSGSSTRWIYGKGLTANVGYGMFISGNQKIALYIKDSGGMLEVNNNTTVNDGLWHHIAISVARSGSAVFYLDGKNDGTANVSARSGNLNSSAVARIGERPSSTGEPYIGLIDDVRIYNYSRTSDQIMQDFNAGSATRLGPQSAGVADPWAGALPVAQWKLDENTGVLAYDASGNGNNGTITGAIWAQGKNGSGVKLTTNDSLSINNFSQTFTTGLSIFGWVKTTSTQTGWSTYRILQHWTPGFIMTYVGGNLRVFLWDDAEDSLTGSQSFNDGNWHYIGFTVNIASGLSIIYVDGKEDARKTTTITTPIVMNGTVTFNNGIDTIAVDDFKVYNYARTQAQIAWDYNKGKPVGYWRFDESSGATCYDDSGNNNGTATIGATGTQTTIAAARANGATGKFGKCMSFDGTDDSVNCGNGSSLNFAEGNEWTISSWIKTSASYTGINGGKKPMLKGTGGAIAGYAVAIGQLNSAGYDNKIGFVIDKSPGNNYVASTNSLPLVNDGNWHHVTIVFDAKNNVKVGGTIYFDGVSYGYVNSVVDKAGWSADSSQSLKIGGQTGEYFTGLIDDARVYNYARTADQIQQDYLNGVAARLGD
jgi:hypothetical protein